MISDIGLAGTIITTGVTSFRYKRVMDVRKLQESVYVLWWSKGRGVGQIGYFEVAK